MFLEYSISPHSAFYHQKSAVYVPKYSLCPWSTIYIPRIIFISLEDSLCPQS